MKLRKYRAASEAEAFRRVKADLGPDAIVLSVKPVRARGLTALFTAAREVEVTAMVDVLAGGRAAPEVTPITRPAGAPRARQEYAEIRSALAEITSTLGRLGQTGAFSTIDSLHEHLRDAYRHLLAQDVEPGLTDRLIGMVREELSPRALDDRRTVHACLRRHLVDLIPTPSSVTIPRGSPITLFLIGPTGVGKTTTIAKLAARFALLERQRVALVTVDTFRIAAAEQLRVYADIMGVPLEVAYTTGDLAAAISRHRDKDIVLIDTPGRSQRNSAHVSELHTFVRAAPNRMVYLTIDAVTRQADLLEIVRCFTFEHLDGLIVTKIDETARYGALLNLIDQTRCPLIYLTTGQDVPDDIEEATPERIAHLVLGGVP